MEQTSSRMDSVLKKLEKVSHMTSSEWTSCACAFCLSNLDSSLRQSCDLCSPRARQVAGSGVPSGCWSPSSLWSSSSSLPSDVSDPDGSTASRTDAGRGPSPSPTEETKAGDSSSSSAKQSCFSSQQVQKIKVNQRNILKLNISKLNFRMCGEKNRK